MLINWKYHNKDQILQVLEEITKSWDIYNRINRYYLI